MEFDVSKVYTAVNADELKIGSKVIAADDLKQLRSAVERDTGIQELRCIKGEDAEYRFQANFPGNFFPGHAYALAYLVEEPVKLKWTDLRVGDVIQRDADIVMVTAIDTRGSACRHIFAGAWLEDDKELKEWRKVEK